MVQSKTDLLKRIENNFTYHRPPTEVVPVFAAIREKALELAKLIALNTPPGREQSTALTRLEEAVMHANAGIARQYPVEAPRKMIDPDSEVDRSGRPLGRLE